MRSIGVIPARFDSTRLPGKPLLLIDDKPMIQHVWEAARSASNLDDLIVATDDTRILDKVKEFGGKAVLTSADLQSGSDRVAEIVKDQDADVVINIQGDEPFIDPLLIDNLVETFNDSEVKMATAVRLYDDSDDLSDPNIVKVTRDENWDAIAFSRNEITGTTDTLNSEFLIHIGIYGYTTDFLAKFSSLEQSPIEISEKLEQMRAIENGYKIKLIETMYHSLSVDTKSDLDNANEFARKLKFKEVKVY